MRDMRRSIVEDRFLAFYRERRALLEQDDVDNPVAAVRPRSAPALTLGAYELHRAREGFASIRHVASGEVMHSHAPPMEEARSLYVEQAQLAELLRREPRDSPVVIWDLGLGAAANGMAAVHCYEAEASRAPLRELHIVSFENDLDSLRLASRNTREFPYLRHGGPAGLLNAGRWQSKVHPGLRWSLVLGDVLLNLPRIAPPPDLVFYDLFSSRTHPEAWTLACFNKLRQACSGHATELFSFVASTAARVAMLGAGFYVAKGRATVDKPESTIAFTPEALSDDWARRHELLGAAWLARWGRSGSRFPSDLPEEGREAFEALILEHPQFRGL
jgi:queuine tRNA-ribosyltransferase